MLTAQPTGLSPALRALGQREIFMRNGTYLMCDVLVDQQQDIPFERRSMTCRAPDGRQFVAVPYLGTWGERRAWMDVDEPRGLSAADEPCSEGVTPNPVPTLDQGRGG
jgi:hypothetical protein